jgi:predicted small lipoprotein YifL
MSLTETQKGIWQKRIMMTLRTFIVTGLVGLILIVGLAACGKRGDPYRPSQVPAGSQTITTAS